MSTPASVDAYLAGLPPATRALFERIREVLHDAAPGATERISYGILRFDLPGRHVLYLAGWKKHVGLYPILGEAFEPLTAELAPFRHGKASVRFPLDQPAPTELIRKIVRLRIGEIPAEE